MRRLSKFMVAVAMVLPFVDAQAEDYGFGDMGGVFNVSESGAATYTLPFDLPDGINGMQPSLGLVYNSQSGNGVAGMGISIYGTSVITRTAKDIYHNGTAKGIAYNDNDAYNIDGVRLIEVEQNDYRPENSPADRFVKTTNGFKANLQNGRIAYYETKAMAGVAYAWYLNKVEDAFGNVILYSYTIDNGCIYLSSVQYGTNVNVSTGLNNNVSFEYENRSDAMPYIVNGTKCSMRKRLKNVIIKTNNNDRNKYTLTYTNTDAFSRLTKVEESYGTTKLPPVTLEWSNVDSQIKGNNVDVTFLDVTMDSYKKNTILLSGDVKGTGKSSLIAVHLNDASVSLYEKDPNNNFFNYCNVFGFPQGTDFLMNTSIDGSYVADYNGDGVSELIFPYRRGNEYGFYISTDSYTLYDVSWSGGYKSFVSTIGGFYNNGCAQILLLETNGNNNKYQCGIVMKTNAESAKKITFNLTLPKVPKRVYASDYNGDGIQDLLVLYETGYTVFWNQGVSVGKAPFSDAKKTEGTDLNDDNMVRSGDFNGDGLADFITNSTDDNTWYFHLNNGNGTFEKSVATQIDIYDHRFTEKDDNRFSCQVFDFNYDGKDDVVITKAIYKRKTYFWQSDEFIETRTCWLKSTGSALQTIKETATAKEDDAWAASFVTGDFDGDGFPEMLNHGYDCYTGTDTDTPFHIYRATGNSSNSNKVTNITVDKCGVATEITYSTLANTNVYMMNPGGVVKLDNVVFVNGPLSVVSQVAQKLANNKYYTNYKYYGLRTHLQGRGLIGFTIVKTDNITTGESCTTTINSLNTTFFEPSVITVKITKGEKTSETETTMDAMIYRGKCHFTYPKTVKLADIYGDITTTTNTYNNGEFYLTKQYTEYGSSNMYKQIEYSSFVKKGGVYKPQTVISTQKHSNDASAFSQKTTYTYNTNGTVVKMVENASTVPVTHEYTYNSLGNQLTHKVSASGITAVTKTITYDATNRYVATEKSSVNSLIANYTYNNIGRLTQKKEGVSGSLLTTSYAYDAIGNITKITYPDGTSTIYTRRWGTTPYKRYSVTVATTAQAPVTTWYDNLGREVETTSTGEKGVSLKSTTSYNSQNCKVASESKTTGNIKFSNSFTYNKLGQLTKSVTGSGHTISYSYAKRQTTATQSGSNNVVQKEFDRWGNVTYVSQNSCTSATYKYNSSGQLVSVRYGDASYQDYMASTMTYDNRGLQTSLTDVDAGKTTYEYDALGRVTKQTDAKGNVTTNTYNSSGLLTKQVCGGVTTTYTYDSRLRLTKETTGNQSIAYEYDNLNRPTKKTYTIDGTNLTYSYVYNSNGQMASQTFPDGMTENYSYDTNGNLTAIKIGGQRVWELDSYTGTQRKWALGTQPLYASRKYSDKGLLTEQEIIRQAGSLHKMTYSFDGATGNLTQRTGMNGTETFKYDQFDRLNTGTSYALNGNIASKTGIGKYTYDTGKKNAVVQVENTSNLIQGTASLTYNAFNKVATVVQGTNTLTITYGPDRQRTKTVLVNGSNTTTTLYADNYEQRTANGVTTTYHYVASPDGLAAVYVKSGSTATAYYIETDHLGSIIRAYDYIGNIKFSAAYDAWGNQTVSTNAIGLTRGYTGHEHWNQFGLIDMNGRFYDPLLGRFLSPDPYVQAPENPQNYNRYSYCLNNPLKYTDPSGESAILIAAIIGSAIGTYVGGAIANNNYNPIKWDYGSGSTWGYMFCGSLIGGASGVAGAGASMLGWGPMAAGGCAGAIAGAGYSGLASGWDGEAMLKGAGIGFVSGFVGGGVGAAIGGGAGVFFGGAASDITSQLFYTGNVDWKQVAFSGVLSLGMYHTSSFVSWKLDGGNTMGGHNISYRQFCAMQADFQRSRFWGKEYGGFLTEDGKVIRFPMKSRSSHGINYTGEIPDGTFAMYHTHWDKPGKTIWINNVGQRVDNSSNLSDLVNARQVTTSRYHGDWDYMPFDSFVINRYDCSFNIGGTTTISIINDVFSRHFLFPFLMK